MSNRIIPCGLQVITCGSADATSSIPLCIPSIEQVTLPNFHKVKNHIVKHSETYSFILLFLGSNDQHSNSDVNDLKKEAHIFAIYFCIKHKYNFTFNSENVYPVAKQFLTEKLTTSIIQFFEQTSERLLKLDHFIFANQFRQKVNYIKHQRRLNNTTVNACHVLIIPMNVTEEYLLDFQERFIDACNDLCREYEPIVYTLDNYFAWNENPNLYGDKGLATMINFIKGIAPIRTYFIGNEEHNIHSLSRPLFESESNEFIEDDEYDKTYTLVEHEPVTERTKQDLSKVLGPGWKSMPIQLKRLDEIRNDIKFIGALEHVNRSIPTRTMIANIQLNKKATDPADDSIKIGASYQVIQQAVTGPTTQNNDTDVDIKNMIQA